MNICFIIEYYPPHVGGGETLFQTLAHGLAERGHSCTVVTCREPGTPARAVEGGVEVMRVKTPARGDRYWFPLLAAPMALAAVKKADVLHTMTFTSAPLAWMLSGMQKKPVVLLAHEVVGDKWRELGLSSAAARFYEKTEKHLLNLNWDAFSCNSQNTKNALAGIGVEEKRLHLIYPGVEEKLFQAPPVLDRQSIRKQWGFEDSDFTALYFGRPGVVKGVENLVAAAPLVWEEAPDFRLVLILSHEPPTKYKQIAEMVRDLNDPRIQIVDPVERSLLPSYLHAADCVAVPSINEGFGYTCAEACAAGLPVVATTAGSLPEVIHGPHVLVKPASVQALAEGLLRGMGNDWDHKPAQTYPIDQFVDGHLQLYDKLIK